MPELHNCPGIERWQALFGETVSPAQRQRYERHLETCAVCQDRLDHAEEPEDGLLSLVRQVGDPTAAPSDPTLTQVLERLHEVRSPERTSPTEPADLYFLNPTDQLELLGTLGSYEVQEVIGQGGMGVVLKAYEPALHRLVAIKVMAAAVAGSATARRRFTREAQAAAAVCHDHIVTVHGVHEIDGLPYLVMQYVPGESLQERLDRCGPLDVAETVRIGLQTASGLAAAHAQGLIHRDIKPANLLLENGLARVKITDFGLARMTDDVQLTQAGVVAGTPEYMAPEQARGEVVDHRADLFSLGSVLYAMCTGVPPFRGASAVAVLRQVSDQEPTPIRALNADVPAWLETLVARLMAKTPGDRFQTAGEVAALLEGYLAYLRQPTSVTAPELPPPPHRGPELRQSGSRGPAVTRLFQGLGLLVLVLLAALGVTRMFQFGPGSGAQEPPSNRPQLYQRSLKGPENSQGLELTGPDADQCVKFEPAGLRITLPRAYEGPPGFFGERPDTGVVIPFTVKGDFEITLSYEILQEPKKKDAGHPQTRFTLDVAVERATNTATMFSRRVEKSGGPQFSAWVSVWDAQNGKNQAQWQDFRAESKTGQLRVVRTGNLLSYYAADGVGGGLKLLREFPFSAEAVEDIRITGSTGAGKEAALDVRVTDFTIRAGALQPTTEVGSQSPTGGKSWWGIALTFSLVIALGLGLLVAVRQSRRAGKQAEATSVSDEPSEADLAPVFVSFQCSGCSKSLKARARLIGKTIKCPRCGTATLVTVAAQ